MLHDETKNPVDMIEVVKGWLLIVAITFQMRVVFAASMSSGAVFVGCPTDESGERVFNYWPGLRCCTTKRWTVWNCTTGSRLSGWLY
jgi:hypothetical protein